MEDLTDDLQTDAIMIGCLVRRKRSHYNLQFFYGKPVWFAGPVIRDLRSFIGLQEVIFCNFDLRFLLGGDFLTVWKDQSDYRRPFKLVSYYLNRLT